MSTEPIGFNWQALAVYAYIAQWLFNIGLAIWVYLRNADSENTKAVRAVASDLGNFITSSAQANEAQNDRLVKLETTVDHLPTDKEVAQIASDVSAMKGKQEGMADVLKRMERQTNLIHEHLLNNRK